MVNLGTNASGAIYGIWTILAERFTKFQFQFHNFYFQSIEITFENSGQTQKTEFSVAEEFAIIIM